MSILRLLSKGVKITDGKILFSHDGQERVDIATLDPKGKDIQGLRAAKIGIVNPERAINQYPFEFSGGMRQRAMIARALACNPALLIADEPTTALDVAIQAQILNLMKGLQEELNMANLFISHNIGVIAQIADDVGIMYMGKIVEQGPVRESGSGKTTFGRAVLRLQEPTGGTVVMNVAWPATMPTHLNLPF